MEKRTGARGRVQNGDLVCLLLAAGQSFRHLDLTVVGQPIDDLEVSFQNFIDAFYDITDHRFRRVIDTAFFPHCRVVFGKKGFIKMHHRIFTPSAAAEVLEDARRIRAFQ